MLTNTQITSVQCTQLALVILFYDLGNRIFFVSEATDLLSEGLGLSIVRLDLGMYPVYYSR